MPSDDESKQDLLTAIRQERAKLDELFASLDEAQRLLSWIERWRATGQPLRPEPGVAWDAGDLLNDRDYARAKNKPVADVRRDAGASYEAMLQALEAMSDSDLAVRSEGPDGPSWAWIVGANTYEHYREHREQIEAWQQAHPA